MNSDYKHREQNSEKASFKYQKPPKEKPTRPATVQAQSPGMLRLRDYDMYECECCGSRVSGTEIEQNTELKQPGDCESALAKRILRSLGDVKLRYSDAKFRPMPGKS